MPRLRFIRSGEVLATLEAEPGDTLLDLVRLNDIPLHWRCGQGTCGTCLVRLRHAGQPGTITPSRKERNVLARAAHVTVDVAASAQWPDRDTTPRLACHVEAGTRDLDVLLP